MSDLSETGFQSCTDCSFPRVKRDTELSLSFGRAQPRKQREVIWVFSCIDKNASSHPELQDQHPKQKQSPALTGKENE